MITSTGQWVSLSTKVVYGVLLLKLLTKISVTVKLNMEMIGIAKKTKTHNNFVKIAVTVTHSGNKTS